MGDAIRGWDARWRTAARDRTMDEGWMTRREDGRNGVTDAGRSISTVQARASAGAGGAANWKLEGHARASAEGHAVSHGRRDGDEG